MACCILLDISSVFCKNIIFGILAIIVALFGFCEVFRAFFYMFRDICFKRGIYICSRWCYTSSSSFIPIGTLWPILPPKIGQSHLSAFMASDFCHGWAISGPLADKNHLKGGVTRAPSQGKVFRTLYVHVFTNQFETWHIHPVGGVTRQVQVSFQSGHFDIFYSQK